MAPKGLPRIHLTLQQEVDRRATSNEIKRKYLKTQKSVKLADKTHKNCNGTKEEEDRVYAKRITTFDLICERNRIIVDGTFCKRHFPIRLSGWPIYGGPFDDQLRINSGGDLLCTFYL